MIQTGRQVYKSSSFSSLDKTDHSEHSPSPVSPREIPVPDAGNVESHTGAAGSGSTLVPRPRPRETHRGHTTVSTLSSQSVVSSARHHARRRSRICSHCRHARAATQSKQYSQHAQTSEDGEPLTANKYGCCMHSRSPLSPPRTRCSPRACALALDPRHASLSHSVTP